MSDYEGPPTGEQPPRGWQPPLVPTEAPPRSLPEQDTTAIDEEEKSARNVTLAVAGLALLVLVGMLCFAVVR